MNRTDSRSRHWTGWYRAWSAIHAWVVSGVTDLRTNSHCPIRWICCSLVEIKFHIRSRDQGATSPTGGTWISQRTWRSLSRKRKWWPVSQYCDYRLAKGGRSFVVENTIEMIRSVFTCPPTSCFGAEREAKSKSEGTPTGGRTDRIELTFTSRFVLFFLNILFYSLRANIKL